MYGTIRMRGALDHALAACSSQPLDRLEPIVLRGLRLGAYELLFGHTAPHAAVAEVVAATRRAGGPRRGGYVNAVLRKLTTSPPRWPDPGTDPVGWATTRGSHPEWVAREALTQLGPTGLRQLADADNTPPTVTLRATPGRATRDELLTELTAAGVDATPARHSPDCVTLPGGDPGALPCVRDGRAVVQDEGSALVTPALGANPGDLVVDLTAGPGGKAGHLAASGARVIAVELHPARARMVAQTAQRLGDATAARLLAIAADALRAPLPPASADAVLVDAPCTNLGSLRRRPEARWRHQPDELDALTRLQDRLLDAAAILVRPGGRILYSVCTWTRAETVDTVTRAAARLPMLQPAPLHPPAGTGDLPSTTRQLWPHRDGTDGIFMAAFTRSD